MPSSSTSKAKKGKKARASESRASAVSPVPEDMAKTADPGAGKENVGGQRKTWSQDMRSLSKRSRAAARSAQKAKKAAPATAAKGSVPSFMKATANSALRQRSHKERSHFTKKDALGYESKKTPKKVKPFKVLRASQTFRTLRKGGSAKSARRIKSIKQMKKMMSKRVRDKDEGPSLLGSISEGNEQDGRTPSPPGSERAPKLGSYRTVEVSPLAAAAAAVAAVDNEDDDEMDIDESNPTDPINELGSGLRRSNLVRDRSPGVQTSPAEGSNKQDQKLTPAEEETSKSTGTFSVTPLESTRSSVKTEEEVTPVPVRGANDTLQSMKVASGLRASMIERVKLEADANAQDPPQDEPANPSSKKADAKISSPKDVPTDVGNPLGSGSLHRRVTAAHSSDASIGDSSRRASDTQEGMDDADPAAGVIVAGAQRTRDLAFPVSHMERSADKEANKETGFWWELGAGFAAGILTAVWLALARGCEECIDEPDNAIEMEPLMESAGAEISPSVAPVVTRDLQEEWLWHNA